MIPTQWFLDEATVTSNSSYGITNFKVDMSVINCEKNIQLMKVAFATVCDDLIGKTGTSKSFKIPLI